MGEALTLYRATKGWFVNQPGVTVTAELRRGPCLVVRLSGWVVDLVEIRQSHMDHSNGDSDLAISYSGQPESSRALIRALFPNTVWGVSHG